MFSFICSDLFGNPGERSLSRLAAGAKMLIGVSKRTGVTFEMMNPRYNMAMGSPGVPMDTMRGPAFLPSKPLVSSKIPPRGSRPFRKPIDTRNMALTDQNKDYVIVDELIAWESQISPPEKQTAEFIFMNLSGQSEAFNKAHQEAAKTFFDSLVGEYQPQPVPTPEPPSVTMFQSHRERHTTTKNDLLFSIKETNVFPEIPEDTEVISVKVTTKTP